MCRLLVLLAVALLGLPATAAADGARIAPGPLPFQDVADGTGLAAPSAADGHVVASRWDPATRRYALVAWDADAGLRVLPVGDRAIPFDADVGRGANGHAVVTWSRCAQDGRHAGVLDVVDLSTARGCRAMILDLERAGARPRELRLAGAAGLSLTTPSVHGRSVAAVASGSRVLLWRTTASAPSRLPGGTPSRAGTGVDALDLGPRSVAFVWRLRAGDLGVGPVLELRSDALRGGPSTPVDGTEGYWSGACGFRQPLAPAAGGGGGIAFLLAQSPCEELQTTLATRRAGATRFTGARPEGAIAYGAAFDLAGGVFWLRGAVPTTDPAAPAADGPLCAQPATGCRLVFSPTLG